MKVETKYDPGTFVEFHFGGDTKNKKVQGKIVGFEIKNFSNHTRIIYLVEVFDKFRSYPTPDVWEVGEEDIVDFHIPEKKEMVSICGLNYILGVKDMKQEGEKK